MKTKMNQSDVLTANDLFKNFESMFGDDDSAEQQIKQLQNEPDIIEYPELDSKITETELKNALFQQKNNKSHGIDLLSAKIFKISFDLISPFLLKLYNRLFRNGEHPRIWGEGIIVPIFKGVDKDSAQNYRGITLINILGKIYSQILLSRLTKWSEKQK